MNVQMANETNLWAENSWAVRTRNGCDSAFLSFLCSLVAAIILAS